MTSWTLTASYCTARKKLDEQMLLEIFAHPADRLDKMPTAGTHLHLFSLGDGDLLSYAIGNKKNHELPLFRKQRSKVYKRILSHLDSRLILKDSNLEKGNLLSPPDFE